MLDCFDGLITLDKTCTSGSGILSLQALDGISETMLKDLTGPEDTVSSMVEECEQWARAIIHNDVVSHFGNKITPHTFLDRKSIGEVDEDQELQTGNTGLAGILVEIDQPASNVVLRIGSLGLYSNFTGTVTITIHDLEDGSIVATHDLALVANASKVEGVQVALPAYRRRKAYFISHDLPDYYRTTTNGNCGSCQPGYTHGGVRINGGRLATGLPMKKPNIRLTNETFGLSAVLTVECDHSQMLCEVKNALVSPYLHKVGEALMRRGIHAVTRMNSERLNLDLLKERASFYAGTYANQMNATLGKMRVPNDPKCFTCNTPVRHYVTLP